MNVELSIRHQTAPVDIHPLNAHAPRAPGILDFKKIGLAFPLPGLAPRGAGGKMIADTLMSDLKRWFDLWYALLNMEKISEP